MNELIEKINEQTDYRKIVSILDKFICDNGGETFIIDDIWIRSYIIGDNYIINVLYAININVGAFLVINDRCVFIRQSYCPVFYRVNFDEIKNKLLNESNSLMNIIDLEEVTGVDINWVTKRVNTKSARI